MAWLTEMKGINQSYETVNKLHTSIKQLIKKALVILGTKGWVPKKYVTTIFSWLKLKEV
jgi:hypothetical protein